MSQLKERILKLLANTDISGRHRKILDLYQDNPTYPNLTYHNVDHVKSVLNLFEVLRKLSGQQFDKQQLQAAEVATAFHDINHSGHPDTDSDNIPKAIAAFLTFRGYESGQAMDMAMLGSDELTGDYKCHEDTLTVGFIQGTAYPHYNEELNYLEMREVDREVLAMVRDADMLWGLMPGNAEHCMMGLWNERLNAGLETDKLDILDRLTKQIKFIQSYNPLSAAGRTFKSALFVDATNAWATVALQYQRELDAIELVQSLSDDKVLELAKAIQGSVRTAMSR
jgi:hypothetical protein